MLYEVITFGDLFDRIPRSNPADNQYGQPDQAYISILNMNRVGIDNKGAAATEFYDPETLLDPADDRSQDYSGDAPYHGDKPAFYPEYPFDQFIACPHVSKGQDILFLVNNQHGQGTNNIKGSYNFV